MSNALKTTLLLGLMTGLVLWIGEVVGGRDGLVVALLFAVVMNFGTYWFSDKLVLRMYGAQRLTESDAPDLFRMVRELTQRAGLPMPALYVISSDTPNAFATGRNPSHAAVAVTSGIVRMLSPAELRGVIAHELGHVANRDTLISAIAATMAGVVMMVARMAYWGALLGGGRRDGDGNGNGNPLGALAMMLLAPLAAMLIQMAISRSREFGADAFAAETTRDPLSLASALEKIALGVERIPMHASPATAHLFIMNPLSGRRLAGLFSTHPPTEERIRRLRALAA
ncbi:MAG TPA: zinc metalloprotease HtpX [Candidatus Limnocylindria bacterium]|nr:zinc metalloprotease HtpX [Candidatus Limnocylindria bacterium]